MHHTTPWYLHPWGLKLVPLSLPPAAAAHPAHHAAAAAGGLPNPAALHLLAAPLPGIYAPEPRKVWISFFSFSSL